MIFLNSDSGLIVFSIIMLGFVVVSMIYFKKEAQKNSSAPKTTSVNSLPEITD